MVRPIYLYGSEVLRAKAKEADLSRPDEVKALVADLWDTLASADGCGLAAPQIGVSLRVVIVDGSALTDQYAYLKDFRRTMVNPVVLEESAETCDYSEGCLSVPGIYADVRRPRAMTVRYFDENLKEVTETFDKFACRMVQHELGHLEGELFTDKVAPIRRKMIARKLQAIAQGRTGARYRTILK